MSQLQGKDLRNPMWYANPLCWSFSYMFKEIANDNIFEDNKMKAEDNEITLLIFILPKPGKILLTKLFF